MTEERKPDAADDPHGTGGLPYRKALAWWLTGAGILLLLPRQWVSAAIALALGIGLHVWHARATRRKAPIVPDV